MDESSFFFFFLSLPPFLIHLLILDPIQHLPSEIVALVLSYLDPESLKTVECISRAWNEAARSHHVWRAVFRTKYGRCLRGDSYHAKTQSLGLGKTLPNQDWKRMFLVRQALEHRWKEGKAAAIYLHGHRDSVYCVQFDEYVLLAHPSLCPIAGA